MMFMISTPQWGHATNTAPTARAPPSWFCYMSAERFFSRVSKPNAFPLEIPGEKDNVKTPGKKREPLVPRTCWRVGLKNTDRLNTLSCTSVLWLKTLLQSTEADLQLTDGKVEALLSLFVISAVPAERPSRVTWRKESHKNKENLK